MAFLEDIGKIFSENDQPIQLIGKGGVVVNSHRGIKSITSREVCIKVGKDVIKIYGETLNIVLLTPYEVYIKGIVKGVCFDE